MRQTFQTSQLPSHAGRHRTLLPRKQNGISSTQQCKLLSEPKSRSRASGHFFLSRDTTLPQNNGAVLNISHILKIIMLLATKAELVGLYIMARKVVYIRIILKELGHKQSPTPLQTNNV